jgi:hypothetical protein
MPSSQKLQAGGTGKTGVTSSGKITFVKPASIPAPTTKINVGGVVMETPVYSEPIGRMASGASGGGDVSDTTGAPQEYTSTDTGSGFSWTWIIVALVAVVVLFFVFKKK